MIIKDRIYGKEKIIEPVIIDLINSKAIQRLKRIDQAGYFEPYKKGSSYSRFEHSVGCFLLLRRFGASIEEQIAGLIHDVSHSAFSHCIDYALDEGSQLKHTYQDSIFIDFVKKTEIPKILKKYNFNPDYVLEEKNFPLQEVDVPDLCADRIDYSLRTNILFEGIDETEYFLDHLKTINNKWIFKDFKSAQKYRKMFSKINAKYFSGIDSARMLQTVGTWLRYSLSKKYISKKDLYSTDKEVLKKVKVNLKSDPELRLLFDRMNRKVDSNNNISDYDVKVFCKSRVVDPLCLFKGKIKRVSEIDLRWGKNVKKELKPKEYFLKFDK